MIIVYASKTGYTRRYALMLAEQTGLEAFPVAELPREKRDEALLFMGWMKAGSIQGLGKVRGYSLAAVCATGTGRTAEPDAETVMARNQITGLPFFYLRGGCPPLGQIKGMDRLLLSMFLRMLKGRKDKDEQTEEAISIIENGFDGVKAENLQPVLDWLALR